MAPSVCLTTVVTPSDLVPPWPPGAVQFLPPSNVQTSGAVAARNLVKLSVVPDSSERCTDLTAVAGSVALGLSFLIAGSFHFVILPAKILAIVVGDSCRSVTPFRL